MYSLVPEKPLRLVYEPWNDAIRRLFKDFLQAHQFCHASLSLAGTVIFHATILNK
jgi:hypothetical protein